jgi:glycopeptide antibiotics resistance protein
VLLVLVVGVVAALTLTPNPPAPGVVETLPAHFLTKLDEPREVWAKLTAAPSDGEQFANIALYVPVGLLGMLVWRSIIRGALFGAILTLIIETCQSGIVGRAGSITDIRNNTAGALLGALVAAVLSRTVAGNSPFRPRRPRRMNR